MNATTPPAGIACPRCGCTKHVNRSTVKDVGNRVRRYKACAKCGLHFVTYEVLPPALRRPGR